MNKEDLFRIGRIGKTHGVKGEVSLLFDDDIFDRVNADYLVLEVDGILVPFFIEEYRFRNDTVALMKFEYVDTQQQAAELIGSDVYFPRALAAQDEEGLSLASLVGFQLLDDESNANVGRIDAIDDSTANILFELEDGTLIPAADELITAIDTNARQIHMVIPEGLLDLPK